MPADKVMKTPKLRPRYMGPVRIKRRRRHWTFEVDIGNTRHHNVYHVSRLKPYFGPDDDGEPLSAFPEPQRTGPHSGEAADGRTYKVERIVRHRGKAGAKNHQYLVKWKGWGPYHASWEPASKVNAPDLIQAYEADLQKQREYLDGVIDDIGNAQGTTESRLDAEAFNQVDAVVCGLMCELPEDTLDWVADRWIERNVYSNDS